ncbi:MAG: ribosome biogenesis GTP-binding protein YihA/YsxC [Mycoplasmataceae bacterium]|jgi:GTP-binding protein|nr:ribosome biogenesis GTP-binding protein YihA/YsxC [Mycoplasmataceae bacterium]
MFHFIKSAFNSTQWIKDDITEYCFVGRSNVGKSTLINALAKHDIARTSKTPGRTLCVNFYDFDRFRIVDLPGYGFASVSKTKKDEVTQIISEYVFNRVNLFLVFLVIDANVFSPLDQQMYQQLEKKFANIVLVVNKIDRLNKNELNQKIQQIATKFSVEPAKLLLVSGKKRIGIEQIWKTIYASQRTIS